MQLKNGHAAAMDKRVDLGSLFCMIGRHGPAVAVAVIAVVSVLAGFIIYRNVKGKRRKAADEDAPERLEQESNRVRSTDVSTEDLSIFEEANPPQRSIRNRHAVIDKRSSPYRPTEKISDHEMPTTSLAQDSGSMMEPRSQDSDKTLKEDGMIAEMEAASCDHGSENHHGPSEPVIGGHYQDRKEGPKSQEDEILEKVSDVKPSKEKVQWLTTSSGFSDDIKISQKNGKGRKTKASRGSDLEEPAIDADQINSCKGPEVKHDTHHLECNGDELKNESLEKFDEQLTAAELEIRKVIEEVRAQDHLNGDAAKQLNVSPQQTQTGLACVQEEGIKEVLTPSDKQNHPSMAPRPLLLFQSTDLQSNTCAVDPNNSVSQLEREVGDESSSDWCKDTEFVPLCTEETPEEKNEGNTDVSVDHWVPSFCKVPEETFCEESESVASSEMSCTVGSFEEQKSNEMTNADLPEVGTVPSPMIDADEVCQIGFEKSELTWSPGAGEESGISSMTVSPDLEEADYDPPTKNVALSREQTNTQNKFFDNGNVAGEIRKDASISLEVSLSLQHIKDQTKLSTYCEEQNVTNQFGEDEMLTIELKQDASVPAEGENGEKTGAAKADSGKTEISIMEATMDTNEWMMEGNEAHPCVNTSLLTVVQRDHRCSSPSEVATSPDKVNQTNTLYTDRNMEKGKKVVAVQPMSQYVHVTFHIHYVTQSPYQKVAITGNQQELGNWKGFIPLEKTKDGHWATVVSLPAESHVEWKFVVVDKGEVCRWEECGNRLLETGSGDDMLVHKWWGFL